MRDFYPVIVVIAFHGSTINASRFWGLSNNAGRVLSNRKQQSLDSETVDALRLLSERFDGFRDGPSHQRGLVVETENEGGHLVVDGTPRTC